MRWSLRYGRGKFTWDYRQRNQTVWRNACKTRACSGSCRLCRMSSSPRLLLLLPSLPSPTSLLQLRLTCHLHMCIMKLLVRKRKWHGRHQRVRHHPEELRYSPPRPLCRAQHVLSPMPALSARLLRGVRRQLSHKIGCSGSPVTPNPCRLVCVTWPVTLRFSDG
jgi:hypothetical protein